MQGLAPSELEKRELLLPLLRKKLPRQAQGQDTCSPQGTGGKARAGPESPGPRPSAPRPGYARLPSVLSPKASPVLCEGPGF